MKTFAELLKEVEKQGLDGYFLAQNLMNAHNRELQDLRDRVDKLEGQLHDNGLEVED